MGLARAGLAIIPRLSRPALRRVANILGRLAMRFGGPRVRQVALANLERVFPGKTDAERRAILAHSFQTFALSMLDVFWLARDTRRRIGELMELDPSYDAIIAPGPMICVTAHLGNWEILGMAVSHRSGEPLASVAATLKNRRVDELFRGLRETTGQEVVPRRGAVRPLLKTLREGRKIALVLDQNTKPYDGGIFVDFLGLPAPISTAAALLALRTGAPVVVGFSLPTPDGRYTTAPLVHVPTADLPGDQDEAVRILTTRIAQILGEQIRRTPEFWVWSYKRWKLIPPGARAEDYPAYARPLRQSDLVRAQKRSTSE